jgi:hypothetical protein
MTTIRAELDLSGWSGDRLRDRVPVILARYADVLGTEFKEQIRATQYDWPGETKRYGKFRRAKSDRSRARVLKEQGGAKYTLAGSPRNIIDSGDFLRSQVRRPDSPTQIRFIWGGGSVTYAGYILNGIPDRNYPARDWISPALSRHPIERFFRDEWNRLGSLGL